MAHKRKKAGKKSTPLVSKTPITDKSIESFIDRTPAWRIGTLDEEGPWGWNKVSQDLFLEEILPKLKNFETMTWESIINGSHEVPVNNIISKAKKRLSEIKQEDIDSLFSLRLTGEKRIWGIRVCNILNILWWDPKHEVCPSTLKHT